MTTTTSGLCLGLSGSKSHLISRLRLQIQLTKQFGTKKANNRYRVGTGKSELCDCGAEGGGI